MWSLYLVHYVFFIGVVVLVLIGHVGLCELRRPCCLEPLVFFSGLRFGGCAVGLTVCVAVCSF